MLLIGHYVLPHEIWVHLRGNKSSILKFIISVFLKSFHQESQTSKKTFNGAFKKAGCPVCSQCSLVSEHCPI